MHDYISGKISSDELLKNAPKGVSILTQLLPGVPYTRLKPFVFDTTKASQSAQSYLSEVFFSQLNAPSLPRHLIQIDNGLTFGQGSVVLPDSRLVLDSAAEFINHDLAPDGSRKENGQLRIINLHSASRIGGTSLLVKRPWYRNYGHWIVDLAAIIPLVHQWRFEINSIIFGDVPNGNLKQMMLMIQRKYYPDAETLFCADDDVLIHDRLFYVQPLHIPPLYKHPDAMRIAENSILNLGPLPPSGSERIYVSRQNLGARRIVNHYEFSALLAEHRITPVAPENLSVPEQIALFRDAKIVVGVKGAGLTNAIFSKPGTHVLVLSPPNFTDPFFWDLLTQKKINYSEIFCEAESEQQGNISMQDIIVDLPTVDAALHKIMGELRD
jgi:capsular polysaccharide biosynthesis protein